MLNILVKDFKLLLFGDKSSLGKKILSLERARAKNNIKTVICKTDIARVGAREKKRLKIKSAILTQKVVIVALFIL